MARVARVTQAGGPQGGLGQWLFSHRCLPTSTSLLILSKKRVSFFGWGLGRVVSHNFQAKAVE